MKIYDANDDSKLGSKSFGDTWDDYVDWKDLMYEQGYTHVTVAGRVYPMSKWGPAHSSVDIQYRVVQ